MPRKTKIIGLEKLDKQLADLAKTYPNATAIAAYQEAMGIFEASQTQVPVDSGNLRQTGLLTVVRDGDGYKVLIGYGAAYALKIHEDTSLDANREDPNTANYTGTRTVGKSKYLEEPFNEGMGGIESRIARRVDQILKKGSAPDPTSMPDVKGTNK